MSEHTDLEDRLRTAVHAHAAGVHAEDGSLDAIRTRVRAAKRRRRAVVAGAGIAAAIVVAVAVPRLGDDGRIRTTDEPGPTTSTEPPSTTTTPTTPGQSSTTLAPAPSVADLDQAIWPDPAGSTRYADPVDAARSFVEDVIGVDDPPLSDLRSLGSGVGEIYAFGRGEDGRTLDRVRSTIVLRQLDGEHWFVVSAQSDDVIIDLPDAGADAVSPLHVTGRGHGFEGTIVVALRERSASAALLAQESVIAGAADPLEPFAVDLTYGATGSRFGILVASDTPGTETGVPSFTAQPVRFSGVPPTSTGGDAGTEFDYQPLWPFRTRGEADAWRRQYQAQGTQPWHLDAEQTALSFTTGYLGFGEIDRVVTSDVREGEAWVGVGYDTGSGSSTAAVVHLVRFGPGDMAPWEVVGTRDADLTMETPGYGTAVSSPITVGGRITGVDECIVVRVRQLSSSRPIGESPQCVPAGGENTPWRATVSFSGATDPALTIVVSTGGHFQGVERFAITGVRP